MYEIIFPCQTFLLGLLTLFSTDDMVGNELTIVKSVPLVRCGDRHHKATALLIGKDHCTNNRMLS